MLFRELTKTYANKMMVSIDIEKSQSIVFGSPLPSPKIKFAQEPKQLKRSSLIPCFCDTQNSLSCSICHGTKTIDENGTFFKFLTSVIDYKMGNSDKDSAPTLDENQDKPKQHVTFKQQTYTKRTVAMSLQVDYNKQYENVQASRLACSAPLVIHKGVQCDGCGAFPLTGCRFQCTECASYDLCAFCYGKYNHNHSFKRLDYPKNHIQKMTLKSLAIKQKSRKMFL